MSKTRAAIVGIREANGRTIRASIHGAGGPIPVTDGEDRFRKLITRATLGRPLNVYEPAPGHVRAYVQTPGADVAETMINLRGASLVSFA